MRANFGQSFDDEIGGSASEPEQEQFDVKAFALDLRRDIEENRIKLPTLPAISLEALIVVNDAGSSMQDLARVVNRDTSMAARLVRYANSPLYRGIENLSSVRAAITRIGMDAVRHAILSLALRDVFNTSIQSIQQRMERLWAHSVEVASRSSLLAAHFSHLNREEAMLAGLIHDLGVIPILIKARETPLLLEDGERLDKLIRALHTSVGRFIVKNWNFEQALIDVVSFHDKLDRAPVTDKVDYLDVVQVANVMSYEGSDGHPYGGLDLDRLPAARRLGTEIVEQVREAIAKDAGAGLGDVLV